jgi:hypothetical protein
MVVALVVLTAASALAPQPGRAQETPPFSIDAAKVQKAVNGALTLMAYSVVPDLAGSLLSVKDSGTGNPGIQATQFGGGSLLGDSFSAYVEGSMGLSRYDPKFIASRGQEQRTIPVKWNTIAGTGGIGWGFPLFLKDLSLIPIFNFSLGHVESDSSAAGRVINVVTGKDFKFLQKGRLNAYGLGGALMLSYARYRERYDLDLSLRYTNILLQSFDTSNGVGGSSDAATVSVYSRLRGPTGFMLLRRPLRYVVELSNSNYVGDQRGVLGFNYLSSAGAGFEIDTSAVHTVIGRVRWVFRYFFGQNVSGYGASIALSF